MLKHAQSESEDSEVERTKEEERKKEEEAKNKQDTKAIKPKDGTKPPSGASSRGAITPSSRKEKQGESRDTLRVNLMKRPGSPNLSEASGNESSRVKRVKIKKTGTSTPRPGDPRREGGQSRQASFLGTAGSGSDTDARTGNPRIRLTLSQRGSRGPSPSGSRAASPPPGRTGSGARSPGSATPVPSSQAPPAGGFPTAEEIAKHIPQDGISIKVLIDIFKSRIPKMQAQAFIGEAKKVARQDKDRKGWMVPKTAAPGI
jgi:transcription initiation factor TFIIF subunit alpha